MANRERGEQEIRIGDQTYVMRLTTAAACELETKTGRSMRDIQLGSTMRGSVTDSCWLLWAALQHHHAATVKTLSDAIRLADDAGGFDGINAQLEAFMALNADGQPEAKPNGRDPADPPIAQPRPSGAGSTSTPAPLA